VALWSSSPCVMELASTGDLRRSLALRRNAPLGALFVPDPLSYHRGCHCHFSCCLVRCLRCSDGSISASSTAHLPTSSTSLRTDAHLMTSSGQQASVGNNEGGSNVLPNDTVYMLTHAVLVLSDRALRVNTACLDGPPARSKKPSAW
jgi:hypothetical protein